MIGFTPNQFMGVHMNDIPGVEDLLTLIILLYDFDIEVGDIVGEVARRNVQKVLWGYWDTTTIFTVWPTLMQSSNLFVVLIVTLSSTEQ